jgi:hypothetical protein
MALYITFETGQRFDLAHNQGWGGFCRWVDAMPSDGQEDLIHLCEHGFADVLPALREQLQRALKKYAVVAEVGETAHAILDALKMAKGAKAVSVTDSLTDPPDEPEGGPAGCGGREGDRRKGG